MDTITTLIEESCRSFADRAAFFRKRGGKWQGISYGKLRETSDSIAAGLQASGFQPGHHAALLASSSPEWVMAYLGILKAGGVVVPIDKELKEIEVHHILLHSEARALFVDGHGIRFSIAEDLLTEPTAELAVALLLGIGRNVKLGDTMVRSGEFQGWRPVLYGRGLSGSTVGIVGMGAIGRVLATRLRGFGCTLVYTDPRQLDPETETALGLTYKVLEDLLSSSDFIVVCAPITPDSFHLIDASRLERLKPGSYLVNIGRGSVIDEAAVALALSSSRLAGYAADVFEFEDWARDDRPAGIHPDLLAQKDKILFTPHLGSAVDSIRRDIALEAA